MFKKLFGESRLDKMEAHLANLEAEKAELQAAKDIADAELKAIQEAKTPKELATEAGEPWVAVLDTIFENPDKPATGYFELDWNEAFVKSLIEAGYSGRADNEIVDMWFNDLCRGVIGEHR
jgi:hypothetical protein